MADIQSSGNGSSGKRTNESAPRTCSLLKPSAFAPTSSFQSTPPPVTGSLSSNPFASTKLPAGTQSEASANQQQQESENPTPNKFFLRPSALDKHTSNLFKDSNFGTPVKANSFKLEPPKLFSPFSLTATLTTKSSDKEKPKTDIDAETKNDGAAAAVKDDPETMNSHDEHEPCAGRPETPTYSAGGSESNAEEKSTFIFGQMMEARVTAVPATSSTSNSIATSPTVTSGEFIFGKNIENRVVVPQQDEQTHSTSDDKPTETENCTSPAESESAAGPSSLSQDAAKRLAKSAESKLELKQVEVITGEEKESNVFQFNAKLYIFNKTSQTWVERGRGLLRLNDRTDDTSRPFQSRLVMRTQGSLRVILNTMIWSGMLVEKAGAKSIQVSAVDGEEGVKIFLINANPNDAEQIYSAIMSRVQQLKMVDSSGKQLAKEPSALLSAPKKRNLEPENSSDSNKRQKVDQDQRREQTGEESNDSSALYPETEASNEGFASSPTIRSSSSSSDA